MLERDKAFVGSVAEIYGRLLVPILFEAFADDLATRIADDNPRDLLETAAGTGVVTRALAALLPATTRIVATDLNQAMIDQAQLTPGDTRITWRQADALALPFEDGSFDAVACQFGAMFFPDKVKGFSEARRVLRPGGAFFLNVWDRIADNDFAAAVTDALADIFPDDPPRFMARTLHGYHDTAVIMTDLTSAGFDHITLSPFSARGRAASAHDLATAFCHGSPLLAEIEARKPGSLDETTDRVAAALAKRFGSGAIEGRLACLVIRASD